MAKFRLLIGGKNRGGHEHFKTAEMHARRLLIDEGNAKVRAKIMRGQDVAAIFAIINGQIVRLDQIAKPITIRVEDGSHVALYRGGDADEAEAAAVRYMRRPGRSTRVARMFVNGLQEAEWRMIGGIINRLTEVPVDGTGEES